MVPTHQGGIDGAGVGAGVGACAGVVAERGAYLRHSRLLLGGRRPLDGGPRCPPARPVLDSGLLVECGDGAPTESEPDVHVRCQRETQRERRVDRQPDSRVRALKLIAHGERGRVDGVLGHGGQRRSDPAV